MREKGGSHDGRMKGVRTEEEKPECCTPNLPRTGGGRIGHIGEEEEVLDDGSKSCLGLVWGVKKRDVVEVRRLVSRKSPVHA